MCITRYHDISIPIFSIIYFNSELLYYLYLCGRVFAHCAMDGQIDPLWWTHSAISFSNQCPMTGVTKAVVCTILSVGWCI